MSVRRRRLRIFDDDVEVAIVVEGARVNQLELRIELAPSQISSTSCAYGNGCCGDL